MVSSRRKSPTQSAAQVPHFIKVSAAGQLLPADAADWQGVYIPAAGLIVARRLTPKALSFKAANEACRKIDLCGAPGERSISTGEFFTYLVDNTRHAPVLDPQFFTIENPRTWIWTCDECMPAGYARSVLLGNGDSCWVHQDGHFQALAVRASQSLGLSAPKAAA